MKIPLPPELLSIEKWKAFRGKYPPSSNIEHIIIIVYKQDDYLKYFYVTSKVDKARKIAKNDRGSLVDNIDGRDWDVLDRESCIQCDWNHLYGTTENDLRKSYGKGEIDVLGKIPENIRISIVSAICSSKTFSDIEKKMYTV